jgi:hypothetical protein
MRLVLIENRLWYLPVAKQSNQRRFRRIAGAVLGAAFVISLMAAVVSLLRV